MGSSISIDHQRSRLILHVNRTMTHIIYCRVPPTRGLQDTVARGHGWKAYTNRLGFCQHERLCLPNICINEINFINLYYMKKQPRSIAELNLIPLIQSVCNTDDMAMSC